MDVEGVLKHSQKHFTSPLVPLVADANADPLSITAVIAGVKAMEASGQLAIAIENDLSDGSIANLTITPLGSYVLLTDELYTSMNSGDRQKFQGTQDFNYTGKGSLMQSVGSQGLGAFVPVATAGLGYDLAVCSSPEADLDCIMWLASKPAPPPSGSIAPTNAMIYTLGSYDGITGICTSTSLQIVGATADWLRLWIDIALGRAAAGAFGASAGSTLQGVDLVTAMAGPVKTYQKLGSAQSAIPLGDIFMSGVGLTVASIIYWEHKQGGPSKPGTGVTIWNLDPNNDVKIAAAYFRNAYVPGDKSITAGSWQDITIPKAIPAGGVWTPEGFNPTTALTMACCTEAFLFLVRGLWGDDMGVAMCAVRGSDSTGVGLKVVISLPASNEIGMQAGIAPNGPAVQSFYNDSSSLNGLGGVQSQHEKISVPAGYNVSGFSSMDEQQMTGQVTFLLCSTP